MGFDKPIKNAKNHITKIPYSKNTSCQIQSDGSPNGAHVKGLFGFENNAFPMVAKGPKPITNQINVKIHAKGINFFLSSDKPETD